MACCVIAALLLAIAHRLTPWRRRTHDVAGFAPQAIRPAPGEVAVWCDEPAPQVLLSRHLATLAWISRFVAVGAGIYLAGVALMMRSHLAQSTASVSIWATRTLVIVAAAVIAMLLANNIFRRGTEMSNGREITGCAAIGLALMTIEATELDMHLFGVYQAITPVLHSALHVAAYAVLILGIAVVVPLPRKQPEAV